MGEMVESMCVVYIYLHLPFKKHQIHVEVKYISPMDSDGYGAFQKQIFGVPERFNGESFRWTKLRI